MSYCSFCAITAWGWWSSKQSNNFKNQNSYWLRWYLFVVFFLQCIAYIWIEQLFLNRTLNYLKIYSQNLQYFYTLLLLELNFRSFSSHFKNYYHFYYHYHYHYYYYFYCVFALMYIKLLRSSFFLLQCLLPEFLGRIRI